MEACFEGDRHGERSRVDETARLRQSAVGAARMMCEARSRDDSHPGPSERKRFSG